MPTFRAYVQRAALCALALSAACLLVDPVWMWLLSHELVGLIPRWLAFTFGTVHSPSFIGIFAGLFLEWFVIGLLVSLVLWTLKSRGRSESAT